MDKIKKPRFTITLSEESEWQLLALQEYYKNEVDIEISKSKLIEKAIRYYAESLL